MKITAKNGEELNFIESGVEGVYILDHVAFEGKFDEDGDSYWGGSNDWDKSSGKKKLQEWAEQNLPEEILERFDIDLPFAEEVFSQKMLSLYSSSRKLKSKQSPIFQNGDNRMMELDGKLTWWWTRSADVSDPSRVWGVNPVGSLAYGYATATLGFVPVLRRNCHE